MKINVNFTIDVPAGSLPALRRLAGDVQTNEEARGFVQWDALEYTLGYLTDNGVLCIITKDQY